jgi:hypothetical protein
LTGRCFSVEVDATKIPRLRLQRQSDGRIPRLLRQTVELRILQTASFTLTILFGRRCVPALLGVNFQSCCKNSHYSDRTKKASAGLSQELPMMTASFNNVKERLARLRIRPMLMLRRSAAKDFPISTRQSTSPTPPKPMTSDT